MRGRKADSDLRAECVRLRIEERLSLREIHDRTGAPKGSLSPWLKEHPLTEGEKKERFDRRRYKHPLAKKLAESPWFALAKAQALTKDRVAQISEAAVIFRLAIYGLRAFSSVNDGDRVDCIAINAKKSTMKIQVKTCFQGKHGSPFTSIRHTPGGRGAQRYLEGDFDFLVGYDIRSDTCYVWSWLELDRHKTAVSVSSQTLERWDKLVDF